MSARASARWKAAAMATARQESSAQYISVGVRTNQLKRKSAEHELTSRSEARQRRMEHLGAQSAPKKRTGPKIY
jgi:hypothetical protein